MKELAKKDHAQREMSRKKRVEHEFLLRSEGGGIERGIHHRGGKRKEKPAVKEYSNKLSRGDDSSRTATRTGSGSRSKGRWKRDEPGASTRKEARKKVNGDTTTENIPKGGGKKPEKEKRKNEKHNLKGNHSGDMITNGQQLRYQ